MGSPSLSKSENDRLRTLCKRAVASGDYTSFNDLGERAGIGGTTLYPIMKGRSGFSEGNAEKISPFLKKYARSRHERAADPHGLSVSFDNGKTVMRTNGHANGHSNGKTNGHANGKSNGHANGSGTRDDKRSKARFTREVLFKLFEVRENTTDTSLRTVIDETIDNWALDGMHILAIASDALATRH
jgi:hypothetical protein